MDKPRMVVSGGYDPQTSIAFAIEADGTMWTCEPSFYQKVKWRKVAPSLEQEWQKDADGK